MDRRQQIGKQGRFRLLCQVIAFAFSNGYVNGWAGGKIYTGPLKRLCVPGLNCYSCPGALYACPVGALQAALNGRGFRLSLYVLGFIGAAGVLVGRLICGFACPFGLLQDLLYRIPKLLGRKVKNLPGHRYLRYLRYAVLAVTVIALPLLVRRGGAGEPWFCEWLCPDGLLLGGIPLLLADPALRDSVGPRFWTKAAVLAAFVLLSVKSYRPFCKYFCPLGALYGMTNPVSLYRLRVDADKCVRCGACQQACGMDIRVWETPDSPECIRCGRCRAACPTGAITGSFSLRGISQGKNKVREDAGS